MKLFRNAIQTDRAFIYFGNIQHFSWTKTLEEYEVKIYSNAGYIIQMMTEGEHRGFKNNYAKYMGVKI